jgi:hypothetical protein
MDMDMFMDMDMNLDTDMDTDKDIDKNAKWTFRGILRFLLLETGYW